MMHNSNTIRLVALDLDGTLLHDDKSISDYTLHVLRRLSEQGIILIPASGRDLAGMKKNILTLPSIRYAICSNGAVILDTCTEKHLAEFTISPDSAFSILNYLDSLPVAYYAHTNLGRICSENLGDEAFLKKYPFITPHPKASPSVAAVLKEKNAAIYKLGLFTLDNRTFELLMSENRPDPFLSFMRTGDGIIEINSAFASKGNALSWICRKLEIPMEQVLTIGDNENDLSMLQMAGTSAAMGNAAADIKRAADYTADTNENDGAAHFLSDFFHFH